MSTHVKDVSVMGTQNSFFLSSPRVVHISHLRAASLPPSYTTVEHVRTVALRLLLGGQFGVQERASRLPILPGRCGWGFPFTIGNTSRDNCIRQSQTACPRTSTRTRTHRRAEEFQATQRSLGGDRSCVDECCFSHVTFSSVTGLHLRPTAHISVPTRLGCDLLR